MLKTKYPLPLILILLLTFTLIGDCNNLPFAGNGISNPFYGAFISPTAYYYNGVTYVVWQGKDLKPYIDCYNHSTKMWHGSVKISDSHLTDDDHGNPAVIVDDSGYIHVFFGSHSSPGKYSKSTNTEDITGWTAQTDIGSQITYPSLIKTSEGILYLVSREKIGLQLGVNYRDSSDWTTSQIIISVETDLDAIYHSNIEYDSTNERIHITWCYWDASETERVNIYHAYLRLSDSHMYAMDGTDLGTEITRVESDADCKIVDSGVYGVGISIVHLDSSNYPYIVYHTDTATGWEHQFIYWSGSAWESAVKITDADNAANGADFIVNSSTSIDAYCITSATDDRGGDLERWHWNGSSWSKISTILQKSDVEYDGLNNPNVVVNGVSALQCVFSDTDDQVYSHHDLEIFAVDSSDNFVTSKIDWLNYDYRIELKIEDYAGDIGAEVTWFPVTIFLKDANGDSTKIFEEIGNNCRKMAITKADGTTELKGEIEGWNYDAGTPANSTGLIHTSADGWVINANTSVWIYYDNDHADNANVDAINTAAGAAVWDGNFKAVYHMADATTSTILDSTSNSNDGTKKAANEPVEATGKVGEGQDFDGADDYIACGDINELESANEVTCEVVCKIDDYDTTYLRMLNKASSTAAADRTVDFQIYGTNESIIFYAGGGGVTSDNSEVAVATWFYLVGTAKMDIGAESDEMELFKNGVSIKTTAIRTLAPVDSDTHQLYIGSYDPTLLDTREFDGIINEVRISITRRADAWIKGTHNSLWDSLLTYGSEESAAVKTNIMFIFGDF